MPRALDTVARITAGIALAALLTAEQRLRLILPVTLAAILMLVPRGVVPERLWRLLTLLALPLFLVDLLLVSRESLFAATHLLLFLLAHKLHHRSSASDYDQLLLVSFLLMLAVSVLAVEAVVILFFAAFLLAALRLLELVAWARVLEGGGSMERLGSSWARTARHAGLALGSAAALFIVIPRVGAGSVDTSVGRRQHVSGFSPEVALDDIGRIKENDDLVARITPLDAAGRELRLLRAVGFRSFDGKRWSRDEYPRIPLVRQRDGAYELGPAKPESQPAAFDVRLEPLALDFLPVPVRSSRLSGYRGPLERDPTGSLRIPPGERATKRLQYEVSAELAQLADSALDDAPDPERLRAYLGLPALAPALETLARELVADDLPRLAAVRAVMRHLRENYRYSLDLDTGSDPLARFLLETREGHCELFATAMAVLLRARGVPARVVNGFRVSEWSELGSYFLVRQSDAHAWVEVYFDREGWVTFDPTPADPERSRWALGLRSVAHLGDFLLYQWDRWVISWDLSDQIVAWEALVELASRALRRLRPELLRDPRVAAALGALALALVLRRLGRRSRAKRVGSEPPAVRLFRALRRVIARAAEARAESLGPLELAERFAEEPVVAEIVALYVRARFAGAPPRLRELVGPSFRLLGLGLRARIGRAWPQLRAGRLEAARRRAAW